MSEGLVAAARALTDGLLHDRDGDTWQGPDVVGSEPDWRIETVPCGPGLYSGSAGIALALAAAAVAAPHPEAAETARAAMWRAIGDVPDDGGLARGPAGVGYAAGWVGHLLRDPDLLHAGRELVRAGLLHNDAEDRADYLGGLAGSIVAALAVHRDDPGIAHLAGSLAADLAAQCLPQHVGGAWPGSSAGPHLLGMAHGASGTALALSRAGIPPDPALVFERSWYQPDHANWPDLRGGCEHARQPGMVAWCHGAIGIGMVRFDIAERSREPVLLAEASAAVESARRRVMTARQDARDGRPTDVTLCHGLLGCAELFLTAAAVTGAAAHAAAARRVARHATHEREVHGWWPSGLPGTPPGLEPPGLFLGRAGILLTLLRVAGEHPLPGALLPTALPRSPRR